MKTVYFLRHAKSSWDDPSLADYDRPLAGRGRKAAPAMGLYMHERGWIPDKILCSGARRARETLDAVASPWSGCPPVEIRDDIYHGGPDTLLRLIRSLPDTLGTVLLVGHNPALEEAALSLAPSGDPKVRQRMAEKYPTGALAVVDLPVNSWKEVREGTGYLRAFVRPKDLE